MSYYITPETGDNTQPIFDMKSKAASMFDLFISIQVFVRYNVWCQTKNDTISLDTHPSSKCRFGV